MKTKTSGKTVLACFLLTFFVLQNLLQQWMGPFQYADEMFALLAVFLLPWKLLKKKLRLSWSRETVLFVVFLAVFWVSGWCGFFRYRYQPFLNAAKDSYVNLKFFLAAGASYLIFAEDQEEAAARRREGNGRKQRGDAVCQMKQKLWLTLNGITAVLFVLCVADLCFGIFDGDMRGGMRAVKLFYTAYTVLAGNCVLLCAVCLWLLEEKKKRAAVPLAMLAFVMLSTRRVKAVGALACILIIYLLVFRKKQKLSRRIKLLAGGVVALAAAAGIYQVVSYYFLMGAESARAVLTIAAPFLAYDHFPFGTGWGTYGSAFSVEPYSPVYGMYRMAGVWGLSPGYPEFVSDTFWPMILGQCGFFGFLAFLAVFVLLVRRIFLLKQEKGTFASALAVLAYLFISSTSESAFANPIAVPLAFWLGVLLASCPQADGRQERLP